MKGFIRQIILVFVFGNFLLGCKDPFVPGSSYQESGILVVEGYINIGEGAITTILLSRTSPINEPNVQPKVLHAIVSIQDENNNTYPLTERGDGAYSSDPLSLVLSDRYRIVIQTENGKEYLSEFTTPVQTPPIDSVSWQWAPEGVTISVSTHDPQSQTRYYQWDYEEVWETPSEYLSIYSYYNGVFTFRPDEERKAMKRCWKRSSPAHLLVASTASLTIDKIAMKRLIHIPYSAEKLADKYSVLVKQHALSRQAYDYLQIMEKNTDDVGSFSDPQPSQLYGNIFAPAPDEPVVGYIGAYTTSQQRIFINVKDLPSWEFNLYCRNVLVVTQPDSLALYFDVLKYLPITFSDGSRTAVFATQAPCADCRIRGGDNDKPDFWE
jgi:hypothetical protein